MKHLYFISYVHSNGFGNCVMEFNKKLNLRSKTWLLDLNKDIADKKNLDSAVIIYFQKIK